MLDALRGVRVLDLTRILAGPFGTMILADLGADVIKIERPGTGDETRSMGPYFQGGESLYFMSVNRSKRSVALDLARDTEHTVLDALAAKCDVLIHNFRPDVAARLGCAVDRLVARHPHLIVCDMSAFGHDGPDRMAPAFDLILQARGGTMSLTGEPDRGPVRIGPPIGDLAGGLYAAIGIAAALYERTRTARGTVIDLSLLDAQASLLVYAAAFYLNAGAVLGTQGTAHAQAFPYQSFATTDRPIVVAVFTDRFWPGFCRAIDEPAWADDPAFATHAQRRAARDTLLPTIEARLASRSAAVWLARFRAEEVPAAPIQQVGDVFEDPNLLARQMIARFEHERAGEVRAVGNPIKLGAAWRNEVHDPPPGLGEDTDAVLREVAGFTTEHIEGLRTKGIVA